MSRFWLVLLFATCGSAAGQQCPKDNPSGPPTDSISRTLSGVVVYHDELRRWFGLQLTKPVCGSHEVQLLKSGGFEVDEANAREIETFRGCKVTVTGPLGIPGTGYYSADLYQNVDRIQPAADCVLQLHLPDYSRAKPSPSIDHYRVSMRIDYAARGGHISVEARSGRRGLKPWQAYASYWLTGGYAFYANCAKGFEVTKFTGTPEAKPWAIDNQIAMDPESAAEKHVTNIRLDYSCRRE